MAKRGRPRKGESVLPEMTGSPDARHRFAVDLSEGVVTDLANIKISAFLDRSITGRIRMAVYLYVMVGKRLAAGEELLFRNPIDHSLTRIEIF